MHCVIVCWIIVWLFVGSCINLLFGFVLVCLSDKFRHLLLIWYLLWRGIICLMCCSCVVKLLFASMLDYLPDCLMCCYFLFDLVFDVVLFMMVCWCDVVCLVDVVLICPDLVQEWCWLVVWLVCLMCYACSVDLVLDLISIVYLMWCSFNCDCLLIVCCSW